MIDRFLHGLEYRVPPDQARLLAETHEMIDRGFTQVGEQRQPIWSNAWADHLWKFETSGYDLKALQPNFMGATNLLRLQGKYIEPITLDFEWTVFERLRDWVFRTFFNDISAFHEFGSGSSRNVAAFSWFYPETPIIAYDWASAAVRMAELLHEKHGMDIEGRRFDFFAPEFTLQPRSGVFTCCALEQVGHRFQSFLGALLDQKPKRVVHIEPIAELYNELEPFDQVALRYHNARGYLAGFLPCLRWLEDGRRIRITHCERMHFGSRFGESYTVLAWEPT